MSRFLSLTNFIHASAVPLHRQQKTGKKLKSTSKRGLFSIAATTALLAGSVSAIPAAAASETAPQACQPFTYYKVTRYGSPSYKSRGPVVSKYNSSSHKSTLTYSIETTQARETSWSAELGGSVGWGIAQVEAKTSYNVTKKVSKGVNVTNRMSVDARKRGYTQPMVEYRKFSIDKWRELGNCQQDHMGTVGRLTAITSHLHFAECQTRSSRGCRPKP